jgi:lysozyme
VSEYQGKNYWSEVDSLENKCPVSFVFIRATVGDDRLDAQFKNNWLGAKTNSLEGLSHYRPNENSLEQAELLLKLFL